MLPGKELQIRNEMFYHHPLVMSQELRDGSIQDAQDKDVISINIYKHSFHEVQIPVFCIVHSLQLLMALR